MKRWLGFLRAPWDGFLCLTESGAMRKFPVIIVILQKRNGDVCSHARPAAFSRPAGHASCAWLQDHRLLHLISFCPKGSKLKSLILAFVALGESLPCSNCQLSDHNQKNENVPVWQQLCRAACGTNADDFSLLFGHGFPLSLRSASAPDGTATPGWKPATDSPTPAAH